MSKNQEDYLKKTNLLAQSLSLHFDSRDMETIRPDTDRAAAVLLPAVIRDGEPNLLFEVRASNLPQGGEICFPGGALENGESSREAAVRETPGAIYVIGNAPTALIRLCELIDEGRAAPALVVGVPVGFVNVIESKERLAKTPVPAIIAMGRKGGSTVASAILNALLYGIARP